MAIQVIAIEIVASGVVALCEVRVRSSPTLRQGVRGHGGRKVFDEEGTKNIFVRLRTGTSLIAECIVMIAWAIRRSFG